MKNNSIPIKISILNVLVLLLLFTIPWVLYQWFVPSPFGYKETMFLLAIIFIFMSYLLFSRNKLDKEHIGLTIGKSFPNTIITGIIGGVVAFIIVILLLQNTKQPISLFALVKSTIYSPIWEELYFRGFMFSSIVILLMEYELKKYENDERKYQIMKYFWVSIAIVLVSLIFLLIHTPPSWSQFIASLFFTTIFYYTKSLLSPIISHAIFNFLISVFAYTVKGI